MTQSFNDAVERVHKLNLELIKVIRYLTDECPTCHTYINEVTTVFNHDPGCPLAGALSVPQEDWHDHELGKECSSVCRTNREQGIAKPANEQRAVYGHFGKGPSGHAPA